MHSGVRTPRNAEAAQANRGGLECSSYTWQVRRCLYAFCRAESQENSEKNPANTLAGVSQMARWTSAATSGGIDVGRLRTE